MTSFSLLGFFKLGFDFPGVLPTQKFRSWSQIFYFWEENNPMLTTLQIPLLWKALISRNSDMPKTENARNEILH